MGDKKKYQKPKIKSSQVKTISFYGRNSLRGPGDSEMLLAIDTGSGL